MIEPEKAELCFVYVFRWVGVGVCRWVGGCGEEGKGL